MKITEIINIKEFNRIPGTNQVVENFLSVREVASNSYF